MPQTAPADKDKIRPRTFLRIVVVGATAFLVFSALDREAIDSVLKISGSAALLFLLAAVVDPQWLLGTVVGPLHRWLKDRYYDLWAATSAREE